MLHSTDSAVTSSNGFPRFFRFSRAILKAKLYNLFLDRIRTVFQQANIIMPKVDMFHDYVHVLRV